MQGKINKIDTSEHFAGYSHLKADMQAHIEEVMAHSCYGSKLWESDLQLEFETLVEIATDLLQPL